jgi:uncharacterized protein HemX
MAGKTAAVVVVIALLIGLLAGYLFWASRTRELTSQLATAKDRLAQAQQSSAQADAAAAKLREAEAQLKQVTADLDAERARRAQLEVQVSRGRK